jgi:hypothetical protein
LTPPTTLSILCNHMAPQVGNSISIHSETRMNIHETRCHVRTCAYQMCAAKPCNSPHTRIPVLYQT